jgi:type I restriction enzyme S subunit
MKQTEIGLIPNDWKIIRFGNNVDIFRGGSPRPIEKFLTTNANGINWIRIGDVRSNDKYIRKTEEKIIPEGKSHSREVKKGDFILSNSMSFGRPYILNIDGCIHDGWLTIQNYADSFDKDFLYYLLSSDDVFKQYVQMAAGSSVQNLTKEKVADLQLKVPPLAEQQIIAKALSDVDALISISEKLIQKKKNIKQGTMQNLLTGKKRLPGFGPQNKSPTYKQTELGPIPEDWEVKKLETLCKNITDGSHNSPPEVLNGYYMPSVKDMKIDGFDFSECKKISREDYDNLVRNGCKPEVGDVLIAKDGSILKYCFAVTKEENIVILSSIAILKPKQELIDSNYLAIYFQQIDIIKKVIDNYKSGTGVPRIILNNFKNIPLIVPTCLGEQTAIANVLSSMGKEIETLNTKLEKCRNLKTAMMQQLLTGKIRLR